MIARLIRSLVPLSLAFALAGCFPYDAAQTQRTPDPARSLAGAWRVIEIDQRFASGNLMLAHDEFRLSFCNDLAGGMRIEADRLVPVHPLRQTERGCIDPDGSEAASNTWDIRAMAIFRTPVAIVRSGDVLLLTNDQGSMTIQR